MGRTDQAFKRRLRGLVGLPRKKAAERAPAAEAAPGALSDSDPEQESPGPPPCAEVPNSTNSEEAAGWAIPADYDPFKPYWLEPLRDRRKPKWDSFSWLTVRALVESLNDIVGKAGRTIVRGRRNRWVAGQRAAGVEHAFGGEDEGNRGWGSFKRDFVVDWTEAKNARFILLGDPGEADASQYAPIEPLANVHKGDFEGATPGCRPSDFMVIVSDVIYPAGDINEYVNAHYLPYRDYDRPIYALPGNHDWYDGLNGFMYHFCAAESLSPVNYRSTSYGPGEFAAYQLWRKSNRPNRDELALWIADRARMTQDGVAATRALREGRTPKPSDRNAPPPPRRPVQPAPYYAIDVGEEIRLVAIDTGISGELDAEQGDWLRRVSLGPRRKILLTGKPLYVDNKYEPCEIVWHDEGGGDVGPAVDDARPKTVDDIVRDKHHNYIAAVGGDIHNYQRYPVDLTDGRTIQYIVSGGGGAYLSTTHAIPRVGVRAEQELPDDVDRFDEESEDPDKGFRCYPLRGDSLKLFTRSVAPLLFGIWCGSLVLMAAAPVTLFALVDIRWERRLAVTLAALVGAVVTLGVIGGVVARDAVVGLVRAGYRLAALMATGALLAAGVTVALVAASDDDVTAAACVTLAVPFVLLALIFGSYEGRGAEPKYILGLTAIAPVIAVYEIFRWFPVHGWSAWALYLVLPLVVLIVAVVLIQSGADSPRQPDWFWGAYSAFAAAAWLGLLVKVLYERADGHLFGADDWLTWAVVLLAALAVWIGRAIPSFTPNERRAFQQPRGGTSQSALLGIRLVAFALVLYGLGELTDDGWAGQVTFAALMMTAGIVSLVLFLALAMRAGMWWPGTVGRMRTGHVDPSYAADVMARKIGVPKPRRYAALATDQKEHSMLKAILRLGKAVAEIGDTNDPPFYKNFMSVEVDDDAKQILFRCHGVTGYQERPTTEDCFVIGFGDGTTAAAHGTEHSHWGLWGTWRRGPDVVGHIADVVQKHAGPATIRMRFRDDEEQLTAGVDLGKSMTGQATGEFDSILIDAGTPDDVQIRVAFVRKPTDVEIGARRSRLARVRAGVVMEALSSDPERGDDVARAASEVVAAIERGRPRWVTRRARIGSSAREEGASASRQLEREVVKLPRRILFPIAFVLASVAIYIGAVVLAVHEPVFNGCTLDWGKDSVHLVAVVVGVAVTVVAAFAQARLFPSMEVATLTSARRAVRGITTASLSAAIGFVLSIPGVTHLFKGC
jgi:uncharacterized protein YaaQ